MPAGVETAWRRHPDGPARDYRAGPATNWIKGSSYFCDSRYYVAPGLAHKLTDMSARSGRSA